MEAALPALAGVPAVCCVQHFHLALFPVSPSCLRSVSLQMQHRWDYRSFSTCCAALLNSSHLCVCLDGLGARVHSYFTAVKWETRHCPARSFSSLRLAGTSLTSTSQRLQATSSYWKATYSHDWVWWRHRYFDLQAAVAQTPRGLGTSSACRFVFFKPPTEKECEVTKLFCKAKLPSQGWDSRWTASRIKPGRMLHATSCRVGCWC